MDPGPELAEPFRALQDGCDKGLPLGLEELALLGVSLDSFSESSEQKKSSGGS